MQYKNPSYAKNARPPRRSVKKRLFLLAAVLVVAGGVLAALELTDTTYLFHKKPAAQMTGGPGSKGVTADEQADTGNSTGSDKSNANPSATLTAPRGPFVSNHEPNLDGAPAPNTINSACSTVSGATCQIIFTKDGVTKSLPAQKTDLAGSTYWNGWKPQDIGLTVGEWKITAKATLGSQTKTAADALPLRVAE